MLILLIVVTNAYAAPILSENFNDIGNLSGNGWVQINNSSPPGETGWFQGNAGIFQAQSGAPTSYIAANFLNAAPGGNISNWLLTPLLTVNNGDILSFSTRSAGAFADRLEVRFSTGGNSSDVGATDASVGDFTNLLLTVNPALDLPGYPSDWTTFQVTLSGLSGPTSGRYGFRYFVTDTDSNADHIGIDTLSVDSGTVPEPSTLACLGIGIAGIAFWRRRQERRQHR
jgi:hypothetical protein